MKIRSLTIDQKKNFKLNVPIYMEFLIATAPKLSKCSHKLYSRALSFNGVCIYTPTCYFLKFIVLYK